MIEAAPDSKPPILYHGRVLLFVLAVVFFPAVLIQYLIDRDLNIWTFAPGCLASVAILALMYTKWWQEGRLFREQPPAPGAPHPETHTLSKSLRTLAFWALIIAGTIALVQLVSDDRRPDDVEISYNQLVKEVEQGNVVSLQVMDGKRVRGTFKAAVTVGERASNEFATTLPFESNEVWVQALVDKGVEVRGGDEKPTLPMVILTFLPYLLIFSLIIVMLRQMKARRQGGG